MRLVQADARKLLATLPDESVDLIITDPPYVFERGDLHFRNWFEMLPGEVWPEVLVQLYRVLAWDRHAYLFCDWRTQRIFEDAAAEAGFSVRRPLIWNKCSIGLGHGVWRPQYEFICFFSKGSRPGNSKSLGDIQPAHRGRAATRPRSRWRCIKQLIKQSSQPGELVLDPFCARGTSGGQRGSWGGEGCCVMWMRVSLRGDCVSVLRG